MSQLDRLSPDFKEGLLGLIRKSPDSREVAIKGAVITAHAYVDKVISPWIARLSDVEIAEIDRLLNEVSALDEKTASRVLAHPFALPITMASK